MKIIKYCSKYTKVHKLLFITFIGTIILKTALAFMITLISGTFIDILVNSREVKLLYNYCIIFAVVSSFSIAINFINGYIGTKIQALTAYKMSRDIFEHIVKLSVSYTKNKDMSYLSQRINNDSNAVISFYIDTFLSVFINSISVIISLGIIIKLDVRIAIILSFLAVLYYLIYKIFRLPIYNKILAHKENSSYFFSSFYESINSISFIKNHSIIETYLERLDKSFFKVLSSLLSYQKLQISLNGCDSLITTIATLIVYIIGGLNIMMGELTVGAFTITLNLFNSLLGSVKFFLNFGKTYQETLASYVRIEEILNTPIIQNGNIVLEKIENIELDNVSFQYDNKQLIKDFSYTFSRGKIYFIIGNNGVGKSTLLSLLMGQHINEFSGNILFNNIDIKNLDLYNLKKRLLGFSEQETILLADTLINNLRIFNNSESKLDYYIEKLDLLSYIKKLDNGMQSVINAQQNNISGGEKQKISIIRQLILDPDVLIFDEPTSALELKSKINLINILRKMKDDKIIIIVTHDRMLFNESDNVIDFDLIRQQEGM